MFNINYNIETIIHKNTLGIQHHFIFITSLWNLSGDRIRISRILKFCTKYFMFFLSKVDIHPAPFKRENYNAYTHLSSFFRICLHFFDQVIQKNYESFLDAFVIHAVILVIEHLA